MMMQLQQIRNLIVAVALAGILAGCVGTPPALPFDEEREVEGHTFSFDDDTYPAKNDLFPKYHVVPGDLLDILFQISPAQSMQRFTLGIDHQLTVKFINMPEMNETQNVQPDGRITLPYIGEVYVAGMSIDELTAELKERYKTIFRDPELYVLVPEFSTAIKQLKEDLHTAPRGLSRLVTVRPDGFATFPVIGDVFVAGKTIPEADLELDRLYANRMPGLQVDLFLEKTQGSQLFVMGQVTSPGTYKIEKPISVFEAITLAGGHSEDARLDNIIVFRRENNRKVVARRVNLKSTLALGPEKEYFYLKPDDMVYVPRTNLSSLARVMTQVGEMFWFRGWSLGGDLLTTPLLNNGRDPNNDNNN